MSIGRLLIGIGASLILLGVLFLIANKLNLPLGRLPGDVVWRGKNSVFYFPWVTCLALSLLASLLFWLFQRR
jgi:ribose/xylose/arabinose/galactoside ABC-type transport system permease subunit